MAKLEVVKEVLNIGKEFITDSDVQKFLVGTYADGKPRNVRDAIDGEYLSPKQKKKATSKKTMKKKTKFRL